VLAELHIRSKAGASASPSGWVAPCVTVRHNPLIVKRKGYTHAIGQTRSD
jgi:hypothetical protein